MVVMDEKTSVKLHCEHCGLECENDLIKLEEHSFCCEGCKLVYSLINETGLCNYYNLNEHPGINQRTSVRENKFSFLDDDSVESQIIGFRNNDFTQVVFYLPAIHCSSCLYLLENIHRFNKGIINLEIHFARKEAKIKYKHKEVGLREVAELLTRLGYEPHISLRDVAGAKPKTSKSLIYRLGIAGFCFGNIMMMSFPEYLGLHGSEKSMTGLFRTLNLLLAIPTFFYSATPFFTSAWSGLKNRFLNIDAPVSVAIIVTFGRSVYEVMAGVGGGFFDSMSGIIFFMLLGRVLQDKTYQHLEFDRDYTSYFPIAVTTIQKGEEVPVQVSALKKGDLVRIYNEEIIPVDGILSNGKAYIDYSFVTGESAVNRIETGEIIYAGGKQMGAAIDLLILKDVSQSYLTQLWKQTKVKSRTDQDQKSFVHYLSKYFSYLVFSISALAGIYWWIHNPANIFPAMTAVLIVACPCALLLSNSFSNGFIIRLLGYNKFFLKDALSIEFIAGIKHIVFDKTGTLTDTSHYKVHYEGTELTQPEKLRIAATARQSRHPLSKAVSDYLGIRQVPTIISFEEFPGQGTKSIFEGYEIKLGSEEFTGQMQNSDNRSRVCVVVNGEYKGKFYIENQYREHAEEVIAGLKKKYQLTVLSGDNDKDAASLKKVFGENSTIIFNQKPEDKLIYIKNRQKQKQTVMMVGDGLNDAGALMQSDVGIAISDTRNNFTPASDVILGAESFSKLPALLRLCADGKKIIIGSFILSILYNIVGVYFSVTAQLSPLVAAILMPASTFSIIIFTYTTSLVMARYRRLSTGAA